MSGIKAMYKIAYLAPPVGVLSGMFSPVGKVVSLFKKIKPEPVESLGVC